MLCCDRFTYIALLSCALLQRPNAIDRQKAATYIASCRNFDGGFGARPGQLSCLCCIFTFSTLSSAHQSHAAAFAHEVGICSASCRSLVTMLTRTRLFDEAGLKGHLLVTLKFKQSSCTTLNASCSGRCIFKRAVMFVFVADFSGSDGFLLCACAQPLQQGLSRLLVGQTLLLQPNFQQLAATCRGRLSGKVQRCEEPSAMQAWSRMLVRCSLALEHWLWPTPCTSLTGICCAGGASPHVDAKGMYM